MANSSDRKIGIIGSGFAGLASAAILAKKNYQVHLFEKNETFGGRARQFQAEGFSFDMGPSWYWMPDVFDQFFELFGKETSDYYDLKKLDPGFQIIYNDNESLSIPDNFDDLLILFESIEKGAADQLNKFMKEAEYKYKVGINDLVFLPGNSITELLRLDLAKGVFKLQVFSSFGQHVRKFFSNPRLISLMEFPILFLGAMPKNTPALYSLMNYAGLKLGTYYPMGGFASVIEGMKQVAKEHGVQFHNNANVSSIDVKDKKIEGIHLGEEKLKLNGIIAAADYAHVEQKLLNPKYRNYSEEYWEKRVFAPSSLIFYLGINKKVSKLLHHNLFF